MFKKIFLFVFGVVMGVVVLMVVGVMMLEDVKVKGFI